MKARFAVAQIALAVAALPASAALTDIGGSAFSFDSSSGLYWLDVNTTTGLSFNEVTTGAWLSTGWRHASDGEVLNLVSNYQGNYLGLISDLGGPTFTYQAGGMSYVGIDGVTSLAGNGTHSVTDIQVGTDGSSPYAFPSVTYQADNTGQLYSGGEFQIFGGVGHFLVNTQAVVAPVPEPETYAMMGLGLGVVAWAAKRKHRKPAQSRAS